MKLLLLVTLPSLTHSVFVPPSGAAFPGYGFSWFDPVCAQACHYPIASASLSCTSTEPSGDHATGAFPSSPECFAGDTAFLTTLAYCMNSTCDVIEVPTWRREKFWATMVTGDPAVVPKWDYSRALDEITAPPTVEFNFMSKGTLNQTVLVSSAMYEIQSRFMNLFNYLEALQPRYM